MLLQVRAYRKLTDQDLTSVRTLEGEFNRVELAQLVNSSSRNHLVVEEFVKRATTISPLKDDSAPADTLSNSSSSSSEIKSSDKQSGGPKGSSLTKEEEEEQQQRQWRQALKGRVTLHRKTVAFAVDIAHAEALTEYFLEAGK